MPISTITISQLKEVLNMFPDNYQIYVDLNGDRLCFDKERYNYPEIDHNKNC